MIVVLGIIVVIMGGAIAYNSYYYYARNSDNWDVGSRDFYSTCISDDTISRFIFNL